MQPDVINAHWKTYHDNIVFLLCCRFTLVFPFLKFMMYIQYNVVPQLFFSAVYFRSHTDLKYKFTIGDSCGWSLVWCLQCVTLGGGRANLSTRRRPTQREFENDMELREPFCDRDKWIKVWKKRLTWMAACVDVQCVNAANRDHCVVFVWRRGNGSRSGSKSLPDLQSGWSTMVTRWWWFSMMEVAVVRLRIFLFWVG